MASSGIPTKYKGRLFRSRLEARWATFFDLVGWKYEYEPFDLDGWIPDFVLTGRSEPLLVEIKPIVDFCEGTASKIIAAGPEHEVLLLGCVLEPPAIKNDFDLCIGWLGPCCRDEEGDWDWSHTYMYWDTAAIASWDDGKTVGLTGLDGSWFNRVGEGPHKFCPYRDDMDVDVRGLWAEAGNRVQWMARQ